MHDAIDDFLSVELPPDSLYQWRQLDLSSVDDATDSLLPELSLEDGEDALDRVGVWAVGRREDVLEAQLVDPLDGGVAVVDAQVVHDEADVVEEVPGPQLVEPDLELLDVHRLVELHHQVDSSLLGDASEHCNCATTILPLVHLHFMPLSGPLVGGDGLGGHHGLVEVDDPEAPGSHHLDLLRHELGLPPDPPLSVWGVDLGDADLLLADVVALVDGAVLGHGDLSVRPPVEELGPALGDGEAQLLEVGLLADDPSDLLLGEVCGPSLLLPDLPQACPGLGSLPLHLLSQMLL